MKHLISLVLGTLFSLHSFGVSTHRHANESYEAAKKRAFVNHSLLNPQFAASLSATPEDQKALLSKIDLSKVTEITKEQLQNIFYYIRDTRFMFDGKNQRRLSWLYPDDGCFARAAMSSYNLKDYPPPHKVFIFGELKVKTPNTKTGYVNWWYHVAVAYRVDQHVFIIDPSINPLAPISIEEWGLTMTSNINSVEFSVCNQLTYDASSSCSGQAPRNADSAYSDQLYYLDLEWNRLERLNRSPEKELGDEPPWKNQSALMSALLE